MKPIEMSSVTCRNFMKNTVSVFMGTTIVTIILCILFCVKGSTLTKPMVLFLFMPVLFVLFNAILNTLRWVVEYELCKLNGEVYCVIVHGYVKHSIDVIYEDTHYIFDTEHEHRNHFAGEHLKVKAFKKFIYILDET